MFRYAMVIACVDLLWIACRRTLGSQEWVQGEVRPEGTPISVHCWAPASSINRRPLEKRGKKTRPSCCLGHMLSVTTQVVVRWNATWAGGHMTWMLPWQPSLVVIIYLQPWCRQYGSWETDILPFMKYSQSGSRFVLQWQTLFQQNSVWQWLGRWTKKKLIET